SVQDAIEKRENISAREESPIGCAYELRPTNCLIELLLRADNQNHNASDLFVRFALCNPDECDKSFIAFVEWVWNEWMPRVSLTSSLSKDKIYFEPNELDRFKAVIPTEIRMLREFWQMQFGEKRGAVRVRDVYSWIGVNERRATTAEMEKPIVIGRAGARG